MQDHISSIHIFYTINKLFLTDKEDRIQSYEKKNKISHGVLVIYELK